MTDFVVGDDDVVLDAGDESFADLGWGEGGVVDEDGEGEWAVGEEGGHDLLDKDAEEVLHHEGEVVVVRRHGAQCDVQRGRQWPPQGEWRKVRVSLVRGWEVGGAGDEMARRWTVGAVCSVSVRCRSHHRSTTRTTS